MLQKKISSKEGTFNFLMKTTMQKVTPSLWRVVRNTEEAGGYVRKTDFKLITQNLNF